jgi:hypothetical protein
MKEPQRTRPALEFESSCSRTIGTRRSAWCASFLRKRCIGLFLIIVWGPGCILRKSGLLSARSISLHNKALKYYGRFGGVSNTDRKAPNQGVRIATVPFKLVGTCVSIGWLFLFHGGISPKSYNSLLFSTVVCLPCISMMWDVGVMLILCQWPIVTIRQMETEAVSRKQLLGMSIHLLTQNEPKSVLLNNKNMVLFTESSKTRQC